MDKQSHEEKIMSYLYGEMTESEKEIFEKELDNNPELAEELESMGDIRQILSQMEDKEVREPEIILKESNTWSRPWVWLSAAAVALLAVAFFTGFQVRLEKGTLMAGYHIEEFSSQDKISREEALLLVEDALASYGQQVDEKIIGVQEKVGIQLSSMEESNIKRMDAAVNKLVASNQGIINQYVVQLKREQRDEIQSLLTASVEQQEVQMQGLLADFNAFLQEQRDEDLDYLTTYIASIEANVADERLETNELLNNIITQVNNGSYIAD